MPEQGSNQVLSDSTGEAPEVLPDLSVANRTISSVEQAFSVCETMISDWKEGIKKAARITSKLNGERPYNQKKLEKGGKGHKSNISTGFLATECGKVVPKFYMPIKTAKYLTAASLPPDTANGPEKSNYFRQVITDAFRAWPKANHFIRGLAREVGVYGFAFSWFPDEYEWRPTLLRMDRGFVPQGTEVMEEPTFFLAKFNYKPHELLDLLKAAVTAGRTEWNQDNVVKAINQAFPPAVDSTYPQARSYEELIRQSTWGYSYSKGSKEIQTWHLFAKEATGTVSHYIMLADGGGVASDQTGGTTSSENRLLFEHLDRFKSMNDVVNTVVFDYGDGTIHGSWGAGQILYDLSVQVEKIRNDGIDNLRMTNKAKIVVPDSKNVSDVQAVVNDDFVIVAGGQFAGNSAGLSADVEGYEMLDNKLSALAQQKIGAFVPPIPLQPSDIKAAQVNAAMTQEKDIREALLENWLIQIAELMKTVTKRLVNPESPDPVSIEVRRKLLLKLTEEEIMELAYQFPVSSVMDFTEYKAQQRGAFAASVMNNPLFRQSVAARYMAEGAGDEAFVKSLVLPDGDQTEQLTAQRQQTMESTSIESGKNIPILPNDNDWVHMQTLKEDLGQMLMSDQFDTGVATAKLQHYAGHWEAGVNKKTLPKEEINNEKQWIAQAEKLIAAQIEAQQVMQQRAQAVAQADAMAAQIVGGSVPGAARPPVE